MVVSTQPHGRVASRLNQNARIHVAILVFSRRMMWQTRGFFHYRLGGPAPRLQVSQVSINLIFRKWVHAQLPEQLRMFKPAAHNRSAFGQQRRLKCTAILTVQQCWRTVTDAVMITHAHPHPQCDTTAQNPH